MEGHELRYSFGKPIKKGDSPPRPFWYCTCTRTIGPGWVCYVTQPRTGMKAGKPERPEAERLHERHVEDLRVPEEEGWR